MSLTNPKDVITEERLSEFYQGIYPYLGGMPEILANKFSKSDLYSTDEKMIGCWVDNRPLYQKTVATGGNVPSGATLIQRTTQTGYDTILYTKTTDSAISIGVDTDYSTDEKIIGVDTDGEWVYQKTFLVTTATTPTSGWTDVPGWSENITNLSTLVKVDFSGCSYSHRIDYKLNGTKLQFYEFGGLSEVIPVGSKLTLQYTKTS